jgi:hypothetical protein
MNICLNCNHSEESHIEYYIPSSPSSSIIVSCIDCENTPLSDELDEKYCSKFEEQDNMGARIIDPETLYNDLVWYDGQYGTLYSVPYAAIETEMCYCGHEENKHKPDNLKPFLYQNACSCNYKSLLPNPIAVINGPCQCSKFVSLSRNIREIRETIKNNTNKVIHNSPPGFWGWVHKIYWRINRRWNSL